MMADNNNKQRRKRANSDGKMINTTKEKKIKSNINENQSQSIENNKENIKEKLLHSGFQKFILSNYSPKQFLELIQSGDIKLHPKTEFIYNLKSCCDDIKTKRSVLINL
jgi:hypothetical protein